MCDERAIGLRAEDVAALDGDTRKALLGYLNLPPVGALADAAGPPNREAPYELPEDLRQALLDRRGREGRFRSPDELLGIPGFGADALAGVVRRIGALGRYGNRVRPVWGGPAGNRELFELIESAEHHIHISMYIIGGEAGLRLAALLAEKARAGVAVRLMFCATGFVISGSPSGTGFVSRFSELRSHLFNDMYVRKRIIRQLDEARIPYLNTSPIGRHWKRRDFRGQGIRSAAAYERWVRARGAPDAWLEEQALIDGECGVPFANVDHRKMIIVDGERAFIGSQNLADSYFYDNELADDPVVNVRNWQWHDNSAVLEGPAVRSLNRLFAERWIMLGGDVFDFNDRHYSPPPRRVGDAVVTIERSRPGMMRLPLKRNLSRMLRSFVGADARPFVVGENPIRERMLSMPRLAERDFYVEHCYPSDSSLLEHWAGLVPGIPEFTMVVPLHYDTKVLGLECDRMYPELIASGATLQGYQRAIMHSKITVVDGWYVSNGSYNLTLRSGRADLELNFFIQCPDYGGAVRALIRNDITDCRLVTPGKVARLRSRFSLPVFDAVVRYLIL